MPNWVENEIRISAKSKEALAEIKSKLLDSNGELSFAILVPEEREVESWWVDPEKHCLSPEDARADGKVFNWYDFHCDKWGCKWDASDTSVDEDGTSMTITFTTAWSAPVHWFDALVKAFPDADIEMRAVDPAMDYYWVNSTLTSLSEAVDYAALKREALVDALCGSYDVDRILEDEPVGVDFYGICTDDLFDPSTWYCDLCVDEDELEQYKI